MSLLLDKSFQSVARFLDEIIAGGSDIRCVTPQWWRVLFSFTTTHTHIPTPASLASRALSVGVVLLFCGSDDMKTKALKVLFGLGLVRGSLPNILLVVDVLLLRNPSFAIKVQYSPPLLCESNLPPHPPTQHLLPINTQHPTHTHRPFGPTSTPDVHRVEAACHLAP